MPSLTYDTLLNSLTAKLHPLYIIHGEEALLTIEALDEIRRHAYQQGFLDREALYVEGHFNWSSLQEATGNISLFSSQKLLELHIVSGKLSNEGSSILTELAHCPPENTVTVIIFPKLDRNQLQSKWFNALQKSGQIIETRTISRNNLANWIRQRLEKQQQFIENDALIFFVNCIEGNLLAAQQEIAKLNLLFPSEKLTLTQIRTAVSNVAKFDAFDLSDAWMKADIVKTTQILDTLKAEGESPVLLLWVLSEDLRMLLRLFNGLKTGRPINELQRELRIWGSKQHAAQPALIRIGSQRLTAAISACAKIDRQIKGAETGDPWLTLHQVCESLCH